MRATGIKHVRWILQRARSRRTWERPAPARNAAWAGAHIRKAGDFTKAYRAAAKGCHGFRMNGERLLRLIRTAIGIGYIQRYGVTRIANRVGFAWILRGAGAYAKVPIPGSNSCTSGRTLIGKIDRSIGANRVGRHGKCCRWRSIHYNALRLRSGATVIVGDLQRCIGTPTPLKV